jgi:hypothetical protein
MLSSMAGTQPAHRCRVATKLLLAGCLLLGAGFFIKLDTTGFAGFAGNVASRVSRAAQPVMQYGRTSGGWWDSNGNGGSWNEPLPRGSWTEPYGWGPTPYGRFDGNSPMSGSAYDSQYNYVDREAEFPRYHGHGPYDQPYGAEARRAAREGYGYGQPGMGYGAPYMGEPMEYSRAGDPMGMGEPVMGMRPYDPEAPPEIWRVFTRDGSRDGMTWT